MTRGRLVVAAIALVIAAGTGTALATTSGAFDPKQERDAFQASVAEQLGVTTEKLQAAYKAAALERIDAAVAAGRLTRDQADELEQRIESGDFMGPFGLPLLGGPGMHGHGLFGFGFDAAADFLGLTEEQLHERLRGGQSLAEVARAEGKSVDGLKQAMLDAAEARLDQAVKDGKLTAAERDDMLEGLEARIDDLVNAAPRTGRGDGLRRPFGHHWFDGPPDS